MVNILHSFPAEKELHNWYAGLPEHPVRGVNGHVHTPYSFSAFNDIEELFSMAKAENVDILGINDFYVTDGYDEFYKCCLKYSKFPLFNIEFIGLMKAEQRLGIRINDPNNPGRIYLSGKGLDYPFHPDWYSHRKLTGQIKESQHQVRQMTDKASLLLQQTDPSLELEFAAIKSKYARNLVRERHIAKAIRVLATEKCSDIVLRKQFFHSLFGMEPVSDLLNSAAVENEIRSKLLKAGGAAFVPESPESFLPLIQLIRIIRSAGGIPCYPVLLDDLTGNFTEFEQHKEKLSETLTHHGIGFIELIPGRNDPAILGEFVHFFHQRGFGIIFGTEHNTPDMMPVTVKARGNITLDPGLRAISYEGAALLAAHQYLRAKKLPGLICTAGIPGIQEREEQVSLGKAVIEYYLTQLENEG
jgi:hypothetical protein